MSNESLDVLCLLDQAAEDTIFEDDYQTLVSVRAAVAELIQKADSAATVLSNLIAARQVDEGYAGIVTDLTAVLSRVGAR